MTERGAKSEPPPPVENSVYSHTSPLLTSLIWNFSDLQPCKAQNLYILSPRLAYFLIEQLQLDFSLYFYVLYLTHLSFYSKSWIIPKVYPCSYLPFDKLTVFLVCYSCYECPCHPYVRVTLTRNWHDVASHWAKSCLLLIRYIPQSKNYFIFKWLKSKLKVHTISWVSLSRNKIIQKAEQKHSLTGWLTLWGSHEL